MKWYCNYRYNWLSRLCWSYFGTFSWYWLLAYFKVELGLYAGQLTGHVHSKTGTIKPKFSCLQHVFNDIYFVKMIAIFAGLLCKVWCGSWLSTNCLPLLMAQLPWSYFDDVLHMYIWKARNEFWIFDFACAYGIHLETLTFLGSLPFFWIFYLCGQM